MANEMEYLSRHYFQYMKPGLIVLKDRYMICQSDIKSGIPDWINGDDFFSFTKTDEEISVICKQREFPVMMPLNIAADRRIIKINGPFDLSVTGIISGISVILAENLIPVFVISTYNTDYLLVKGEDLENTVSALHENGYKISFEKSAHEQR